MKKWLPDSSCSACAACMNICPKDALALVEDEQGFAVPVFDKERCVDCGQCVQVCPVLRKDCDDLSFISTRLPEPKIFACWSKFSNTRICSTSGGAFSELARCLLDEGGYVVGAVYSEDCMGVLHDICSDKAGLIRIRQSKYVQSEIGLIFRKVKERLKEDGKVLFCGSPCQVAGLYSYLGNTDTQGLYTADFICRGVNSPKAYRAWLTSLEQEYDAKVRRVWFKNKEKGWNCFSTRVDFTNGKVYRKTRYEDFYMRSYLKYNLFIRPSCTQCRFKGVLRMGDVTLADFWGINREYDDDRGTSMVIVNSEKGSILFGKASAQMEYHERTLEEAINSNACLSNSVNHGRYSQLFFERLNAGIPFPQIFSEISHAMKSETSLSSDPFYK